MKNHSTDCQIFGSGSSVTQTAQSSRLPLRRLDTVLVLGSLDPEMISIRNLLRNKGYKYITAQYLGQRCLSNTAYNADRLTTQGIEGRSLVWVECRTDDHVEGRDLIVDHHNVGDPGYSAPPSEYWEGSSIGHVSTLVGGSFHDFKLVAASDHCLSAALRGECPNVDPIELMNWRIDARARMAKIPSWQLKRRIIRATEALDYLPTLSFSGTNIVDASFCSITELRDAAAMAGRPILKTRKLNNGKLKVHLYGAKPDVVREWIRAMENTGSVDHSYGNPFREYAGVVLNHSLSDRLIANSVMRH